MKYKFYVDFGGFQKEIEILHKPLSFNFSKYNDKISYNFVTGMDTELIFVDHPTKNDTSNKIWNAYTYIKALLDSFTSKLDIAIYFEDSNEFFWRGSVLIYSENEAAWDLNKKVFRGKATELNIFNELSDGGDIEVNIQEIETKYSATDSDSTVYDNAMSLHSVFEYVFQEIGVTWDLATDILPIISTLGLDDIFVYDKSDAKRPDASQNATITNVKANELIQLVCDLFNVKFEVVNNIFSFKHYTEREFQAVDINSRIKGVYNNSFAFTSIPAIETLKCEEANTEGFTEYAINYDINNDKKETYKLSDFCVDLGFIIENRDSLIADSDSKDNISDTGLFFAGVNSLIIQDLNSKKNGVLAYENLFTELWQGDRFLPRYTINGNDEIYRGTVRKIKEMTFTMDYFMAFNPTYLQGTQYGSGEVVSAVLAGNKLTLKLLL